MGRKRHVSPEYFTHPEMYQAEVDAGLPLRIAFAGLWTQVDRRGVFEWKPLVLKLAIMPFDVVDFEAVLSALESTKFIQSYTVDGKRYGVIPSFPKWQTFHRDERASRHPGPDHPSAVTWTGPDVQKHSGRTMPAPLPHGASTPVISYQLSVIGDQLAVAVARDTSSALLDELADQRTAGQPLDVIDRMAENERLHSMVPVRDADPHHRVLLAVAANDGIEAQLGARPVTYAHSHVGTHRLAQQLEAAAVDIEFARSALYTIAKTRPFADGKPPRTLAYFAGAVIDAWKLELQRRLAVGVPVPAMLADMDTASSEAAAMQELFAKIERGELLDV